MMRTPLILLAVFLSHAGQAQPLLPPGEEGAQALDSEGVPLVLRAAANPPGTPADIDDAIAHIRREMRDIARAALNEADRRAAYADLYRRSVIMLPETDRQTQDESPRTVTQAVDRLERLLYRVALDTAPDAATHESLRRGVPGSVDLEPVRPASRPASPPSVFVLRDPEAGGAWWGKARVDVEALALEEIEESPVETLEPEDENLEPEATAEAEPQVAIAMLADEKATVELHDDQTILRDVETDAGGLVLFDRLHIWAGGAIQYDASGYRDLFAAQGADDEETDTALRRAEVIVRSTLNIAGEVKFQYDIDDKIWRDLYFRHIDDDRGYTLTVGNQAEPFSQESLLGNKFNAAMEIAAPTSAFGNWRGLGVRLHKWFDLAPGERYLLFQDQSETLVTTSLGLYGEDIENSNDTDIALTGRVTFGRQRYGGGFHTGLSLTLRDGEFDRIAARPEIQAADRITLARFDAEQAAILGLEGLFTRGPLHVSAEGFVGDYRGGGEDARGYGGFVEIGYYLTGEQRSYRPQWGVWAPLQVGARNVFEVFARLSHTFGEEDNGADNSLSIASLGGSWYRHKFRASLGVMYARTDRAIENEDDGVGASVRLQYLF